MRRSGRLRLTKRAAYRERGHPAHEGGMSAAHPAGQLDTFRSAKQFKEERAHFHPRQLMSNAEMRSAAEGDMRIGRAVDAECAGIREHGFVPVARIEKQRQPLAGPDPL